jgi:DNA repair protein RadC
MTMRYTQEPLLDRSVELPMQSLSVEPTRRRSRNATARDTATRALREALEPYVDLRKLRQLAAHNGNLQEALITGGVPEDVQALIAFFAELLRPVGRDQVKSPSDAAAFLMARMGLLDQEELWTVLLNTKNYVIKVHRVYQGSLNASMVRIGEVFREALRLNAASLIVAHNHPSGSVEASPEDILVTRQIVEAGKLLDCEVLDHIICSRGCWLSMRERGLGFNK